MRLSQAGRHDRHARRAGRGDRRRRRCATRWRATRPTRRSTLDVDEITRQANDNPVFYVQYAARPAVRDAAQRRRPRARPAARRRVRPRAARARAGGRPAARARRVPARGRHRRRAARAAPGRALPGGHRRRRSTGSTTPAACCRWATRSRRRSTRARLLLVEATRTVLANGLRPARRLRAGADVVAARTRPGGPHGDGLARGPAWLRPPRTSTSWSRCCGRSTARKTDDGALEVGGVDVRDLVAEHGSPAYVLDEADFRARARAFRDAFAGYAVYYAGKAFLCTTVARWVAEEGLHLDVCTGGELAVALRAGVRPGADRLPRQQQDRPRELRRAVERRRRPDRRRLVRGDRAAGRGAPASSGATAAGAGPGDGRRRGAHPRVHRDRPRGPEVRLLDHRGDALDAVRRVQDAPGARAASACTRTSGRRSSTPPGSRSPRAGCCRLHAQVSARARRDAARARPRRRLRHRLHHPGRPVRPGAAGHRADARSSTTSARALGVAVPALSIEPGRAIVGPAMCTLYEVGTVKEVGSTPAPGAPTSPSTAG